MNLYIPLETRSVKSVMDGTQFVAQNLIEMKLFFKSEVIKQLKSLNSDTSKSHSFDFYIYVPTEEATNDTASIIGQANYSVVIMPAAAGLGWLCKATQNLVPEEAPLDEIHDFLKRSAVDCGGDFGGWESDVVRSK